MELGKQIKFYRNQIAMSQEELADRIYVSRQTISNWENDKSYPDIHSLVLLSEIFRISIDELVKGDIYKMKEVIQKEDVMKMKRYEKMYTILLIVTLVSVAPLFIWLGNKAWFIWISFYLGAMYYALKIEKFKKEHDIYTYKEIVAFYEGKKLDEIQRQREIGKRPYQRVLLVLGSGIITIIICILIGLFLHFFLN